MSIIATAVKHLMAAGVTGDALVRAIAEMEAAQPVKVDAVAEKRRAYDRNRKRNNRVLSGGIPVESADTPPNDIYNSNPPPGAKAPSLSDRVVEAWNEGPGQAGAPKARKLDANRRKALCARLKEHTEAEVFEAIANIAKSDWHCGKNDRGWAANLGWVLKNPENFNKALELGDRDNVLPLKPSTELNLAQQILARKAAGGG